MQSRLCFFIPVLLWIASFQAVGEEKPSGFDLPTGFDLPLLDETFSPFGETTIAANGVGETKRRSLSNATPTTTEQLLDIQDAAIEVARKAQECTVALELGSARGSGVVISEDGYILTASHVTMRAGQQMTVRFPNGRITKAKALGHYRSADAAIAKITEDFEWPFAPLATREQAAKPGDWCVAVGHPGGFDIDRSPPARLGRVIEVREKVMQTDCTIMGGDSGGPLFDLEGRVIGIHSRISEDLVDNLHVPSNSFHEGWDRMKEGKEYPKPVPSKLLSMLDANNDGMLTREEQKTKYHRRVFNRLVEEFELEGDEFPIRSLARETFQWQSDYAPTIDDSYETNNPIVGLAPSNYVRGGLLKRAVTRALHENDPRYSDSKKDYVNPLTVRVYGDGRRVALGTIVGADGFIVTKASRLRSDDEAYNEITCRLPDATVRTADIVARDESYDLALLKVAASNLTEPIWNMNVPERGQFTVLPEQGGEIESLGIVGVPEREIRPMQARMGISLGEPNLPFGREPKELRVFNVFENSGAEQAGIQLGDLVLKVDNQAVTRLRQIHRILDEHRAGDEVPVLLQRNDKEIELSVRLMATIDLFAPRMDTFRMSGPVSRRRDGFESAFQIDAPVKIKSCGGPVLDLNGHLLGVTLARADRVATYVIGSEKLESIVNRMRSDASAITTTRLDRNSTK